MCHQLESLGSTVKPRSKHAEKRPWQNMEYLESELAETQLALQQVVELSSNEARGYINPTVWIASGLGLEIGNASSVYVKGRNFSHMDAVQKSNKHKQKDDPVIVLGVSDAEVK